MKKQTESKEPSLKERAKQLMKNKAFRAYAIKAAAYYGKAYLPASDILFLYEQYINLAK